MSAIYVVYVKRKVELMIFIKRMIVYINRCSIIVNETFNGQSLKDREGKRALELFTYFVH